MTFSSAMPEVIRQSAMSPNRKATAMTADYTVPDNPPDPEAAALVLLVRVPVEMGLSQRSSSFTGARRPQ